MKTVINNHFQCFITECTFIVLDKAKYEDTNNEVGKSKYSSRMSTAKLRGDFTFAQIL